MKSKKQDNIGISALRSKGGLTNESKEKAEILNTQFRSLFTKTQLNEPSMNLPKRTPNTIPKLNITSKGVEKLLSDINSNKAMGPDSIPNLILKNCNKELAPGLTILFQNSVDRGSLPNHWRSANVAPVYKNGGVHAAENYRPVSLVSVH